MSTKATNTTLAKIADNEPIFVLRARDIIAPTLVRSWVRIASNMGVNQAKLDEALAVANEMEAYSTPRVPD